MSFADWDAVATRAAWDVEALRNGRLVWRFWWERHAVDLDSIVSVTWRAVPEGGAVRIETSFTSHTLGFKEFTRPERLGLIRLLRRVVPHDAQSGWPEFCRRTALPLRRSFEPPRPPAPGDRLLTRRRWDVIFGVGIVGVVLLWHLTADAKMLAGLLWFLPMWLLLRFSHPKEGVVVRPDANPPSTRPVLAACLSMLLLAVPIAVMAARVAERFGNEFFGAIAGFAVAAMAFLPVIFVVRRYGPADRAWRERRTAEALAEWDRLEPSS